MGAVTSKSQSTPKRDTARSTSATSRARPTSARGLQRMGSRGPDIRDTQSRLNARGARLAEDGIFGPKTQAAVRQFQRQQGLTVDGIVGPKTQAALTSPTRALRPGMHNRATGYLQQILNHRGHNLAVDGRYGPQTTEAVRAFQKANGLSPDGVFGPQTFAALRGGPQPSVETNAPTNTPGQPTNRTATFDKVSKRGQRSQMVEGRVTINGNTYRFRSGGGGRGNLPPGQYTITPHRWSRSDRSMQVGGVGYSFAMSDKYDPRVGGKRTLLRIHPDGGGRGTIGCMGIVGNAGVQRRFREDMRAELARNGGRFTLRVGI